jgi:hypothetical protein
MTSSHNAAGIGQKLLSTCLLAGLLSGCTVVGPTAIRSGRLAYNEAINDTNNQQMLMIIVTNRYGERGSLLAVSSVTANVSVIANSAIQVGIGDNDNYRGNLVPFGAGVIYEENPTISYTPVAGEKYIRQLMSPLPLAILAQLTGTMANPAPIYTALVADVNGIHNPDFRFTPAAPDQRFERFVELMTGLTHAQCLRWIKDPNRSGGFSVAIDHYAPHHTKEVGELLTLLGLPMPEPAAKPIVLPVSLALDGRDSGGIGIITYSVYDLVEILSATIEIPEADRREGLATSYPPVGRMGQALRVHYSKTKPKQTAVAVQYRGGWFYIDDKDQATKGFFRLLGTLWSVTIAESTAKGTAAPVLTVPVSR